MYSVCPWMHHQQPGHQGETAVHNTEPCTLAGCYGVGRRLHQFLPSSCFLAQSAWLPRLSGACCLSHCVLLSWTRSVLMALTDPVRHLQALSFLVQRAALTALMESSTDAFTLFAPDDKVSSSTNLNRDRTGCLAVAQNRLCPLKSTASAKPFHGR
jgi:hypothetical protein